MMRFCGLCVLALYLASVGSDRPIFASAVHADANDLVVHEWGTFTTVAGEDGQAVQWLPLGGPTDLPCFVHYFQNRQIKLGTSWGSNLTYDTARTGMKGTVRMETPVLYFYTSQPTVVDVSVRFRRGLFSEWYPSADVEQLGWYQNILTTAEETSGSITWKSVRVQPGDGATATASFRTERGPSHYYAARATDAAPVQAADGEREKFLFYRGVAGFAPPISAKLESNGSVTVTNLAGAGAGPEAKAEIPSVILFTKRGDRLGYRVQDVVRDQTVLAPPALDGTFASLRQTLERTLIAQGLYPKEAAAMIDTWRDSWFENGTRLFYIVPTSSVERVLPLKITPQPTSTVRVFVGRMDVIEPADITAVQTALATHNRATLERYGRLLGPITDRIEKRAEMTSQLDGVLKSYAARVGHCDAIAN